MTTIKKGVRSSGGTRPYVWFTGTVLHVPTAGLWLGVAMVDDDAGSSRHVSIDRLALSTTKTLA